MTLLEPPTTREPTTLLEEALEGMSSAEGVASLLERMALVLRVSIVRVFAIVEALAELCWRRGRGELVRSENGVRVGDGPGLESTSYASLRAAIFSSDPPSLSG